MLLSWLNAQTSARVGRLVALTVCLVAWMIDTRGSYAGSGDEPHYAMIAHSIVFDRDFDVANDYADRSNLVGAGTLERGEHAIAGRNGVIRPVHDIGMPVIFAPYFAVAYWIADSSPRWMPTALMRAARLNPPLILRHLLSVAMIALTGLLAYVLFECCRSMSEANAPPALWTLLCAVSPPIISHAFLFFTEIPAALIVAFYIRECIIRRPDTAGRAMRVGAAVGFLLLLHIRNAPLVVAMTALMLWDLRRARLAWWFTAPVAAFGLLRTAVNYAFWGGLVTNPHASFGSVGGVGAGLREIGVRAFGLLLDQEHGLLMYAPMYLLILPGAMVLFRRDRGMLGRMMLLVIAYVVPIVLPVINRHGFDGGWSPAARFLLTVTPALALIGFAVVRSRRGLHAGVAALVALQLAIDVICWTHPRTFWNGGTGTSALIAFVQGSSHVASWLPSWHFPTVYGAFLSVAILAIWIEVARRAASRT